jgi:hypothetical protein
MQLSQLIAVTPRTYKVGDVLTFKSGTPSLIISRAPFAKVVRLVRITGSSAGFQWNDDIHTADNYCVNTTELREAIDCPKWTCNGVPLIATQHTLKVGDCLTSPFGNYHLIQIPSGIVSAINTTTGYSYRGGKRVVDPQNICKSEAEAILGPQLDLWTIAV